MKIALLFTALILSSCSVMVKPIAGNFKDNPNEMREKISPKAKELIEESFKEIKEHRDYHVHAVGMGTNGTSNWVNPGMNSWLAPYKKLQYSVYMSASGIKDPDNADIQYADRLVALLRSEPRLGKAVLFAFDYSRDENGEIDYEHSSFYIPNEYVWELSQKYPDVFIPAISVHPHRKDSIEELTKWGERGVKYMKWLPNSMRIDPSNPKLKDYYEVVKKYGITIITHSGHEKAVEGEAYQELGSPLKLKFPLDMGVKIMMAHLASLGDCHDTEANGEMVSCFDLFWRMFLRPEYKENLIGEISGTTIYTRIGRPIQELIKHPEYAPRLVNGSDYPLPAINILYRTGQLVKMGFISEEERDALNEIYQYNPILFNFVLKRTLRDPNTKKKLSPQIFEAK